MFSNTLRTQAPPGANNTLATQESLLKQGSATSAHLYHVVDSALEAEKKGSGVRTVLSDSEFTLLRDPLVARMEAGLLSKDALEGFISAVAAGGIPREIIQNNPLLPIEEKLTSSLAPGEWLPPHLTERLASPSSDFGTQQTRIIEVMQRIMRDQNFTLPLFFCGSSAVDRKGALPFDVDIFTSCALRREHMTAYDKVWVEIRKALASNPLILGDKNHAGVVTEHMVLALGISVARYGKAFRVTSDEVYAIIPSAHPLALSCAKILKQRLLQAQS